MNEYVIFFFIQIYLLSRLLKMQRRIQSLPQGLLTVSSHCDVLAPPGVFKFFCALRCDLLAPSGWTFRAEKQKYFLNPTLKILDFS